MRKNYPCSIKLGCCLFIWQGWRLHYLAQETCCLYRTAGRKWATQAQWGCPNDKRDLERKKPYWQSALRKLRDFLVGKCSFENPRRKKRNFERGLKRDPIRQWANTEGQFRRELFWAVNYREKLEPIWHGVQRLWFQIEFS